MRDFTGRVAVITGGGSGIGEALARRFARAGMKIVDASGFMTGSEMVVDGGFTAQ